jgi:aryl-alcohol dehydrogenase-like predicted oxidoreductase
MQTRPIPRDGQPLPVVGCGTWLGFDVGQRPADRPARAQVLRELFAAGGSVIDTSPMYGSAEDVVGGLLAENGAADPAFIATKVWTTGRKAGIAQMERSLQLLRAPRIDLLQVHNLVDWRTHLDTLLQWKADGRIRYIGITHYTESAYPELEQVLRAADWDFVQFNYSAAHRRAEERLLPLAAERGVAVLVNLPFGGGKLLKALRARPLPGWAADIGCTAWSQLLLKFVLARPEVTCVIPGTSDPGHMRLNALAGSGEIPGPEFWTADRVPSA